ncbi:Aspartate decarboxylase-like domain-containing protein [Artemisia annua]|uniref:DNA-directed RNA polymerase n=1 Tax=Artemisia annua TaxID=35608 RepID=A0A2U1KNF4_ARTAN|nr:Aspartate decarboxylase-like domain-containing protein [Artemisia annua]
MAYRVLMLKGTSERGAKKIRVHVLTDGSDVLDGSSVGFAENMKRTLQTYIAKDDLTHQLAMIIRHNENLRRQEGNGAPAHIISGFSQLMQFHVALYFDNELPCSYCILYKILIIDRLFLQNQSFLNENSMKAVKDLLSESEGTDNWYASKYTSMLRVMITGLLQYFLENMLVDQL